MRIAASCRFTPTRVGTTLGYKAAVLPDAVHPHARGDNTSKCLVLILFCGSPPRAWGQLGYGDPACGWERFTPTRVGTTPRPSPPTRPAAVHPHARGDNIGLAEGASHHYGSPPRAWGQRIGLGLSLNLRRFTPTRVGTT